MTAVHQIIEEINLENGSNHKIATMKKYKDNTLLARIFSMTYDRVKFTYGVSMNHWIKNDLMKNILSESQTPGNLEEVLDFMENQLATRQVTGNEAIDKMHHFFMNLSAQDALLVSRILSRDLRINAGRTLINKVFTDLIQKPAYMRCGVYSAKAAKDISFPAIVQLKADGTYREAFVDDGKVEFVSRSGESYEYPLLASLLAEMPDGHYTGELVVRGTSNRSESNGLINSDDPPHDLIDFLVWDYITNEEYSAALKKGKNKTPYSVRFEKLGIILDKSKKNNNIHLIPFHIVNDVKEALELTSKWMEEGHEGSILKDLSGVFKDGTSKHQLKLKIEFNVDVRITGFTEGRVGTVREKTFGAISYETDDGKIKGQVSGFTDKELQELHENRKDYIGKIMEIQGNDLTRGRYNEHYAVSHPRFIRIRTDRDDTDTLERAQETVNMAKSLS